ncbi:class I SAM-dependent methyltransferase [Chitinivorax sp. B]|uniref:class I SAM-dependent methyltransferase n=1 Tax=Chitinivorax sp. B TaxID=2502235 RepID=UPI0010F83EB8|nr:class I SAM-dependent methyltransferase [Chitinivorax sp. B]
MTSIRSEQIHRASASILLPLINHLPKQRDALTSLVDIGCGPGHYTIALAKRGFPIVGVDHSAAMLYAARNKAPKLPWVRADVHALPLEDQSVDVAISTLSSHYWRDRAVAYRELRRVARHCLVEFTNCREYIEHFWLNRYFPKAMRRTAERFPTLEQLRQTLRHAGFCHVDLQPWFVPRPEQVTTPVDGFLYCAKYQPARYLDDDFREAIGTFVNDIEPGELNKGLQQLSQDIANGTIAAYIASIPQDVPDYLFIIAE